MKKIVTYLIALTCVSPIANASKNLCDQEERMTIEGQKRRYIVYQAEQIRKEREAKKERKNEARRMHQLAQERKEQAELEQQTLPTQVEYMNAQSNEYMLAFMPFVKKVQSGFRGDIPEIIQPRVAYFIPHRTGVIELNLAGYSSTCKPHVVNFIDTFLESVLKNHPQTCNVVEAVYFPKDMTPIQNYLKKRLVKKISNYNREAEKNNKLRKVCEEGLLSSGTGARLNTGGGFLFAELSPLDFSGQGLLSFLALQQTPVTPELAGEDIAACIQMITTAKFVKVKLAEKRLFSKSNFQGVQY